MQLPHQSARCQTFVELKDFIYKTLCQREKLVVGAFPMTEHWLRRCGVPCGVLFVVHGPRNVVFNAVWAIDCNHVLFYGSSGERFQTTRLTLAPRVANPVSAPRVKRVRRHEERAPEKGALAEA